MTWEDRCLFMSLGLLKDTMQPQLVEEHGLELCSVVIYLVRTQEVSNCWLSAVNICHLTFSHPALFI